MMFKLPEVIKLLNEWMRSVAVGFSLPGYETHTSWLWPILCGPFSDYIQSNVKQTNDKCSYPKPTYMDACSTVFLRATAQSVLLYLEDYYHKIWQIEKKQQQKSENTPFSN